jgi:hypothetical protein
LPALGGSDPEKPKRFDLAIFGPMPNRFMNLTTGLAGLKRCPFGIASSHRMLASDGKREVRADRHRYAFVGGHQVGVERAQAM